MKPLRKPDDFSTQVSSRRVGQAETPSKKAILVVSFGASLAETRTLTIEACEQKIRAAFPDYEVRRAFTSQKIIAILNTRDHLLIDTPEEALERLRQDGFTDVIVQPLHIIAGIEFHDIARAVAQFRSAFHTLKIGMPLLAATDDYLSAASVLKAQLPAMTDDAAVVLMGHGTAHPANAAYLALARAFDDLGMTRVFIGTVEGSPELSDVIRQLKQANVRRVTLMPFMLAAGDHALNDMAGDGGDSWKNRLTNEGLQVNVIMRGLGENPGIQDIYAQHVRDAIAEKIRPPQLYSNPQ